MRSLLSKTADLVRLRIVGMMKSDPDKRLPGPREGFMSLQINTEQIGDIAVLQCAGRMVCAQELCVLKEAVTRLSQLRVIMLDLSEVDRIDSDLLGLLLWAHGRLTERGAHLVVARPSSATRGLLAKSGLDHVLKVSDELPAVA